MQKKVATCREERGKPESSISADIEMVLEKYKASHAAYHGGDYNGVSCRRIVGNSSDLTREIAAVLQAKKEQTCSADVIKEKIHQLDITLGLLNAAFYYLNIPHPNNEEKERASDAVKALSTQWRKIQLSVTLKAHVIEQHIVPCNNKYVVGDKEESLIELGHQVGPRENHRYQGLKNFRKKTEASLKVRSFDTHPLVKEQAQKVLQSTKRVHPTAAIATNKKEKAKTVDKKNIKEEEREQKKMKRDHYVSMHKDNNENKKQK
jgi:hypothetical protein